MKDLVLAQMQRYQNIRLLAICTALISLVLDQVTKWLMMTRVFGSQPSDFGDWLITPSHTIRPQAIEVWPFFNFVTVWNPGISFGMLQYDIPWLPTALLVLTFGLALVFFIWMLSARSCVEGLALALIVGGAIGNGLDRLKFGAVFDFLDFHAFGWHWPAFNVADASLVVGVILMIIAVYQNDRQRGKMVDFEG